MTQACEAIMHRTDMQRFLFLDVACGGDQAGKRNGRREGKFGCAHPVCRGACAHLEALSRERRPRSDKYINRTRGKLHICGLCVDEQLHEAESSRARRDVRRRRARLGRRGEEGQGCVKAIG